MKLTFRWSIKKFPSIFKSVIKNNVFVLQDLRDNFYLAYFIFLIFIL